MDWKTFDILDLAEEQRAGDLDYLEFLKVSTLRTGLYELKAGAEDPQQPHTQDEVYYVIQGRAVFEAGSEARPVASGSVIYVRAGVDHRFREITEDLQTLVFFSAHTS
ncbi:MAG: cupin domain-containing protein [bacterium]|nr:cupin domain-containing protein [bacterium]